MNAETAKKEDHRSRVTKRIIRESLLPLLKDKSVGSISVAELCREAGISRSTFYAHYNVPEDVLEEIQSEVVEQLAALPDNGSVYEFMLKNCEVSLQNKDFCLMVARDHRARAMFRRKLLELTADAPELYDFPDHPTPEQSEARFRVLSVSEGCAGIMNDWHERGMVEPPEVVAKAVADFVARCGGPTAKRN
ncbi:MAG: TetR/AcrR family transcriptional regulator [Atopobiaceae bacterium]|nr:TetR/AcrR family transcriptional regulator [Atopobiaceae bacterium]